MMSSFRFLKQGVTLIEVLIYMAIFSIASSAIWGAVSWIQKKNRMISASQTLAAEASDGITVLVEEIAHTFIANPDYPDLVVLASNSLESDITIKNYYNQSKKACFKFMSEDEINFSLYQAKDTNCESLTYTTLDRFKRTEAIFQKIDAKEPFFNISTELNKLNFNFMAVKNTDGLNLHINFYGAYGIDTFELPPE